MALTVRDIIKNDTLKEMKLIAGKGGLNNDVSCLGIADYEFLDEYREDKTVFESEMVIISTLLFAKDNPDDILNALKFLVRTNCACLCYKNMIFNELPQEVIDYANEFNFPIFSYGIDIYTEQIIYEVLSAIALEDQNSLSETNIKKMIDERINKPQLAVLIKNISLRFKEYVQIVYIKSEHDEVISNVERNIKNLYLNKASNKKAIACNYDDGLFLILTSDGKSQKTFDIILNNIIETLTLPQTTYYICKSSIYKPYENLDRAFRESYFTYIASISDSNHYEYFKGIGLYKILAPLRNSIVMKEFADSYLLPLKSYPDCFNTIKLLVINGGNTALAAESLNCHINTIRYRISKAKQYTECDNMSDSEFFSIMSVAIKYSFIIET